MIKLSELLVPRGLTSFERTKMVRHRDPRVDVKRLRRRGFFEFYQATQGSDLFAGCSRIVSFIGEENGRAVFCGVYAVAGSRAIDAADPSFVIPAGYPYPETLQGPGVLYDLRKEPGFEDLEDRVVIAWTAPRRWDQWWDDREVVEVLPAGHVVDWPGYDDVILPHADLKAIVAGAESNREWVRRLSAVAGIYCILHEGTGEQYIGSACGGAGIWGRWTCYAETGHGGNVKLQERCEADPAYVDGLVFSILQTLPISTSRNEVLALEARAKRKLGARKFGLNGN